MSVAARFAGICLFAAAIATAPASASAQVPTNRDPVYLEADTMTESREGGAYFARGSVRLHYRDRILHADEIEYRPADNRVIARGNVAILTEGAPPQFADKMELDDQLGEGVAAGFSTLLENEGKAAAAFAVRRQDGSVELTDAYYTACELCPDGSREPTWRLRANRVVRDTEDQMIYYRDATLEVFGVPVFYTPAFAHADPSSERRSGLLFPSFGYSSRFGAFYQQPYYWAISSSQDLTIAPRLIENVRPLLTGEYRKRFHSGYMAFEGSYTFEQDTDSDGQRFGDAESRWHVFGAGEFRIDPVWWWGFTLQRTSHDLHLRRYDLREFSTSRLGIIPGDNRRLASQIFVQGRGRSFYSEAFAAAVQSLRPDEDDDTLPFIAPVAEWRSAFSLGETAGRVSLVASATVLERRDGPDYRRISASSDWRTQWIAGNGMVFEPFAFARADAYSQGDLTGAGAEEASFTRVLGHAGAEWRWPFVRPGERMTWVVEPVVQIVGASDANAGSLFLNEDSLVVDLDEALLFSASRAPGYDVWEEGVRAAYGARATATISGGGSLRGFLGQSVRLEGEPAFAPGTGLFEDESNVIAAVEVNFAGFSGDARTRLNPEDGSLNRLDLAAGYRNDRFSAGVRYVGFSDELARRGPQQELILGGRMRMTENWEAVYAITRDLESEVTRSESIGLVYRDHCTELAIIYEHDNMIIGPLGPSRSVQVRVTLFTLGSFSDR